ncbi:2-hydroxyacyl-CoA lyase 2-like [Anomalospiza imberbis]|uniref:2-hydroxyacyl-CoA lyase 2-like n=1 Tax=Anomalospiza imberbis TaxID=187417 RepID=UPI003590027B
MDLVAGLGCACAGLVALVALVLLVVAQRLGLLYCLFHKAASASPPSPRAPGVTNAVTAVKNAQMAESPLLLLAGAAATLQKGRGALQGIPQLPLFRTLCKSAFSVGAVRDIVPTLRRAIAAAMEGTPDFGVFLG